GGAPDGLRQRGGVLAPRPGRAVGTTGRSTTGAVHRRMPRTRTPGMSGPRARYRASGSRETSGGQDEGQASLRRAEGSERRQAASAHLLLRREHALPEAFDDRLEVAVLLHALLDLGEPVDHRRVVAVAEEAPELLEAVVGVVPREVHPELAGQTDVRHAALAGDVPRRERELARDHVHHAVERDPARA